MADRNDADAVREALSTPPLRRGLRQCLRLGARHHGRAGGSHRARLRRPPEPLYFPVQRGRLWRRPEPQGKRPAGARLPRRSLRPQQGHHRAAAVPHALAAADCRWSPSGRRSSTARTIPFYREQFFWDRLRAGRPIIIPGDGHRLMQFVYVNDLVQAMVRAMEEPRAVGEAFNIGDTKPVTQVELVEQAGAAPPTWRPTAGARAARRHPAGRRQRHGRAVSTSANTSTCRPSPKTSAR